MDYPLVLACRAAGHRTRKLAMRLLDDIGLFPGQEVVLLELAERGDLNQVALAVALDIEPPSVAGIVVKLEAAGLVARTTVGRQKVVRLTDTGRAASERVVGVYADMERMLGGDLTPTQLESAISTLRHISSRADAALADGSAPSSPAG